MESARRGVSTSLSPPEGPGELREEAGGHVVARAERRRLLASGR